jgi:RNA polymerase sigma-70 factor (ECF subfamily)
MESDSPPVVPGLAAIPATAVLSRESPLPSEPTHAITRLLEQIQTGSQLAREELLPLLYEELHAIAQRLMRGQSPGHTLQTTALVNEALLKIFKDDPSSWETRAHFLGFAAHAMRSVLVDHARSKGRIKRSPLGQRVPLDELVASYEERSIDLVALDEALEQMAALDPRMVRLVELRFFGGRTMAETAEILGVPMRTAEREWRTARAWLKVELE